MTRASWRKVNAKSAQVGAKGTAAPTLGPFPYRKRGPEPKGAKLAQLAVPAQVGASRCDRSDYAAALAEIERHYPGINDDGSCQHGLRYDQCQVCTPPDWIAP